MWRPTQHGFLDSSKIFAGALKAVSNCTAKWGLVHSTALLYSWIFCLMWESLFFRYSHLSLFSKYVGSWIQNKRKTVSSTSCRPTLTRPYYENECLFNIFALFAFQPTNQVWKITTCALLDGWAFSMFSDFAWLPMSHVDLIRIIGVSKTDSLKLIPIFHFHRFSQNAQKIPIFQFKGNICNYIKFTP